VAARKILGLQHGGNTANAFMRDTLAPLVVGTTAYEELKKDIFDE
jgi:hypothetical protein